VRAGTLPDSAEILIVGGGITGVSLLYWLSRRRRQAVLVERSHLAAGASGRNAGFLLAGLAANYADAVRIYGRSEARETWHFTAENHVRLAEVLSGCRVDYARLGSDVLAASPEEASSLAESEQLLREDGFQARWDGSRLFNPGDGELDPVAAVRALAALCPPGSIREGVEVTALEECRAEVVVLATNGYTAQLLPEVPIRPVRGQMLATGPVRRRLVPRPTYSHLGYRYWRQRPDGCLLVGGWRDTALEAEVGYEERPTEPIQKHLDAQLRRLGSRARVTRRWAGIMGFTEDGLPLRGPVAGRPGVFVCGGYNGHGMGFAFLSAKELAERL